MEISNLNEMAAFIASARYGSFTAAAQHLGLTRSTIGKRIARLEARLNVRLLNRNTRNLSLTDDGQLFFEHCVYVLDELECAEQSLAQRTFEPVGRLRISAPLVLGKTVLPHLLQDYMRRYPRISVELSLTDRYVDLIEEGFDMAIRNGLPPEGEGLIGRIVGTQHMLTCASPAYLRAHGIPQTPADLSSHQCLHFMHNGRISLWRFEHDGKPKTWQGDGRLCADNGEALLPFAQGGFGIVQLPHYLVGSALEQGTLQAILADHQPAGVPIMAVYPSRRQLSPRIRLLIDYLIEHWSARPEHVCPVSRPLRRD